MLPDRSGTGAFALVFLVCTLSAVCCQDISTEDSCQRDVCPPKPKCRIFDPKHFGPKNKTIIYGEARGRLGNQLLGYALLFQLGRQLGVDSFIDASCRDHVAEAFTPENVEVPVLAETFCNPQDIRFEAFNGRFADLLTDEKLRKGKLLNFYPPDKVSMS
jgi:hypothetical protein